MNLQETLDRINAGDIKQEDLPEVVADLNEEIFQCDEVIKDPETEWHVRKEYRETRSTIRQALLKLQTI